MGHALQTRVGTNICMDDMVNSATKNVIGWRRHLSYIHIPSPSHPSISLTQSVTGGDGEHKIIILLDSLLEFALKKK